jgi:hypothetical protein
LPVARPEGALDGFSRITAPIGKAANGVFLLERKPRRQRAKPPAGSRERGASDRCPVLGADALDELVDAPADGAICFFHKRTEPRDARRLNERVGILRVAKEPRLEHAQRWCVLGPAQGGDGSGDPFATGGIIVEGEHD